MLATILAALLTAQAAAAPPAEVRSVLVSVTDEKGAPVPDVQRDEVAVLEAGVAREPTRVQHDERPLTLSLLVDTTQVMSTIYRLNVVGALTGFLGHLPTGSRFAIWTTGDRPTKLVDFTDDPNQASNALKRVAPQGGSTMLDAIVEASRDLKKIEGARAVVVAVTGLGPEFSSRDRRRVVEDAGKSGAVFMGIQFEAGPTSFEDRQNYEYVLDNLAKDSGGLYQTLLSPMGMDSALQKVANEIGSQYRVSFASLPEAKVGKIEVKIARPGVRVRVGPRQPVEH
jgi:VWFA-related protein